MIDIAQGRRPEPLVAFVTRQIQTGLANGKFEPGVRLSPKALADEYGVSHIPVREALTSLASVGYVVHRPAQGFFARRLTVEELADIYHWRAVLETEAYRVAIPELTDEDLDSLRQLVSQMSELTSPEDRLQYLEMNREYHFVVFRRAGSDILLQFLDRLWDLSNPYAAAELSSSQRSHQQHLAQLELYAARDVDAVIEAMAEHRGARVSAVERWQNARFE